MVSFNHSKPMATFIGFENLNPYLTGLSFKRNHLIIFFFNSIIIYDWLNIIKLLKRLKHSGAKKILQLCKRTNNLIPRPLGECVCIGRSISGGVHILTHDSFILSKNNQIIFIKKFLLTILVKNYKQ